ncbi:hypothetical protein YC2023_018058 [Brassica napus]
MSLPLEDENKIISRMDHKGKRNVIDIYAGILRFSMELEAILKLLPRHCSGNQKEPKFLTFLVRTNKSLVVWQTGSKTANVDSGESTTPPINKASKQPPWYKKTVKDLSSLSNITYLVEKKVPTSIYGINVAEKIFFHHLSYTSWIGYIGAVSNTPTYILMS